MSDENKQEEIEEQAEEVQEPEAEQTEVNEVSDPVVSEAKKTGHLSSEEYRAKFGNLDGFKSEKEYVLTGELIELKKIVQKRDKDFEELIKYHQNTVEQQKVNFKAQLEARLQQARDTGDIPTIEKLTSDKKDLEVQERQNLIQQQQASSQQAASWFADRNKTWYNSSHPELQQECLEIERQIIGSYSNYMDLAQAIEIRMKDKLARDPTYAHLVNAQQGISRPTITSTVGAAATAQASSDSGLYSKLASDQRAMYDALKRINTKHGVKPLSVKDFINKMKRDSEI